MLGIQPLWQGLDLMFSIHDLNFSSFKVQTESLPGNTKEIYILKILKIRALIVLEFYYFSIIQEQSELDQQFLQTYLCIYLVVL